MVFWFFVFVLQGLPPLPPPALHCNGHVNNINMVDFKINDKKSAIEASNDLTRRIAGNYGRFIGK